MTWASSFDIVFNSGAFAYSSSNMLQENDQDKGGENTMAKKALLDKAYILESPSSMLRKLLIVQEQTRVSMSFVSKLKQWAF